MGKLIESNVQMAKERNQAASAKAALRDLFYLVNSKLNINLAILEVTLYGSMIRSVDDLDYGLPKPWTKSGLGVMNMTMNYRSMSVLTAYQGHQQAFRSPISFTLKNRPDHPLDVLVMPREVLQPNFKQT